MASVDPFGGNACLCCWLYRRVTMPRSQVQKALTALVLAPVGCPESLSVLFDSTELRLAGCEKYTTGARAATVNSSEAVGPPPIGGDREHVDPSGECFSLSSLDVTVASFLAPCLANLKIFDVDSFLKEICWRIVDISFILTRNSLHGQHRLASTSCVKGSKDCLSWCGASWGWYTASGVKPQNTGIFFGNAGMRHARFDFEVDKNQLKVRSPLTHGEPGALHPQSADTPAP